MISLVLFVLASLVAVEWGWTENRLLGPAAAPANSAPQIMKPIVTLTHTDEKTSSLIDKLRKLAHFQRL